MIDLELVFELICRRTAGGNAAFSDLSLLDAESSRAATKDEHRRRLSRNREALWAMHECGLLELVDGPAYECFQLTEAGSAKRERMLDSRRHEAPDLSPSSRP